MQGPNSNQNMENMRVDSSSSSRATVGRPGTPAKAGKEAAAETQETKGKLENSSLKGDMDYMIPKGVRQIFLPNPKYIFYKKAATLMFQSNKINHLHMIITVIS